jgi:5-methylthioribose kinase
VLEDLGEAQDFTPLYRGERLSESDLEALVSYLVELHRPFPDMDRIFENREMRALNHEHIFRLPLARGKKGTDLDRITPGLGRAAREILGDKRYVYRVRDLGALYLEDGPSLVHGDFFPGSWLRTERGIRVIDPEFCFLGTPAFDLGVLFAHLMLSKQTPELSARPVELYFGAKRVNGDFLRMAFAFAGVEIMRRIMGVAQLPLEAGLDDKREFLELSKRLII